MNLLHNLFELAGKSLSSTFVSGGLVLMFTGSLIAFARNTPLRIYGWLKSRVRRVITIENSDPLFDYVTYWMDGQERFRRSRELRASTDLRLRNSKGACSEPCIESCSDSPGSSASRMALQVFYSPSMGRHLFRYRGHLIGILRNSRQAQPNNSHGAQAVGQGFKEESYSLEYFGRGDGSILKDLINEIVKYGTEETEVIRVYVSLWGGWRSIGQKRARSLDSVILPNGDAERILTDMRLFRSREAWYRDLGIPWHRGYLFYGLPGTGKTSLAAALAGALEMDVYLLNIAGTGMNDERLQNLMGEVREGSMVILEDIDCTAPDRDSEQMNRVTLSGLLNCLDGIASREGCLIVMTTNHREALDAALIRNGRVDFSLEFSHADDEQIERLAARIGVPREGIRASQLLTMADVQKELLERHERREELAERIGAIA